MRRLMSSALVAATLPGLAAADERPSLLDYFSVDIIVQRLLQTGIMGLRTQMDLKYSDMSVDFVTGKITITDLVIWPLPEWDIDGTCEIAVDRMSVRGGALDEPDRFRLTAQMNGVTFPSSCIPDEIREALDVANISEIDMPRMTIDMDYGLPDSDLLIRSFAHVNDVAAFDLTGDFAYFWFDGRDDIEEPLPVAFLRHGSLSVQNLGLFDKLKPLAPPPFVSAGAGDMLKGMLGEELARENRFLDVPIEGLSTSQSAFLDSMASSWEAFLGNPDTLVLETNYDGDVYIDFEALDRGRVDPFEVFQPVVRLAPSARQEMLPASLLKSAMEDATTLSVEDRKRVGIALMTGVGAPRNARLGFELLNDMARSGDSAAAMAMATAMEHHVPEDAYRFALLAGAGGETGATAMLDRIEKSMDFATVLKLQNDVSGDTVHPTDVLNDIALVRAEAAKRLLGRGAARSYEIAAMWAMLAAASGDGEGQDIMGDITERARLLGADAQAAWRQAESNASRLATEAWISQDLPARFGN